MLSGRDEHALFHQTGGVADAGDVASTGFNGKTVEVGAVKDNAGSGWRWKNSKADRRAAVESFTGATHRRANCLLLSQGEDVKSFTTYRSEERRVAREC